MQFNRDSIQRQFVFSIPFDYDVGHLKKVHFDPSLVAINIKSQWKVCRRELPRMQNELSQPKVKSQEKLNIIKGYQSACNKSVVNGSA